MRWQGTVRPEIQAFYGALAGQRAKKGVFITTLGYTAQALQFAQSVESVRLAELEGLDT
ncbi:restriction endonuclease [Sphaerotilus sulfidivorans]